MFAGFYPIFIEDVHELIATVEGIHEHPDSGEERPILHAKTIRYFFLLLASVIQFGVYCCNGVNAIQVIEFIISIDNVVVDILRVQFGVELGGNVMGEVLELLDHDGNEVLGLVEEGFDGEEGVGVGWQYFCVVAVDGDAVVVELQHSLHVVVLQPV